jgi:integrase
MTRTLSPSTNWRNYDVTLVSRGSIRKRKWVYQGQKRSAYEFNIVVERDGVKKRTRRVFLTRAEATEALDVFREETKNPVTPAPASAASITLAEAFERYFKAKARKRSLREDQRIAKHLKAEFGEQALLSALTASRISLYQERLLAVQHSRRGGALSAASINRPLALLRSLLRMACRKWEVLAAAPVIELEKEGQGRLRWLTHEEAIRLLEACREQKNATLVDLVEFSIYTGLRQGEALGLPWGDVDRSRGVVLLEVTKSGERREVPLCGPADAVLARRADAGKAEGLVFGTTSWDAFRKHWERAVKAAKLAKLDAPLRFHDLRHTFASWAMQEGATLPELQKLLGHATLAMTMRYAHLAPKHLRAAVSRLNGVLQGTSREQEVESLVASK